MPGLMTTFVDVGLNDKLAEALSRKPGFEWAAWDSYRRFLQTWAMASGIDRDVFDAIMVEFKARYGVERKSDFLPEHMREMAFAYKAAGPRAGRALHRRPLPPGDGLHPQGAGLLGFARGQALPAVPGRGGGVGHGGGGPAHGVRQPEPGIGVGRHLHPQPAGAAQQPGAAVRGLHRPQPGRGPGGRPGVPAGRCPRPSGSAAPPISGMEHSLEKDHPQVYQALLDVARDLVGFREHDPQEIEFTFESDDGRRTSTSCRSGPWCRSRPRTPPTSTRRPRSFGPPVAVGMGVAGGAYSGRVAMNAAQIDALAAEKPGDPIVLLRPDTVPEDIAMITRVSGLLTARGGATSHAAVTAKRLGKTRRGGLPGPGGGRAPGRRPPGRTRAQDRRLALHRRAHREHLPGPHPHHVPSAAGVLRR